MCSILSIEEQSMIAESDCTTEIVFQRGHVISGYFVYLTVERNGLSFHFTARCDELVDIFYGKVYRNEVLALIEAYNDNLSTITKSDNETKHDSHHFWNEEIGKLDRNDDNANASILQENIQHEEQEEKDTIKKWEYDKILDLLLSQLELIDPIPAFPKEIRYC